MRPIPGIKIKQPVLHESQYSLIYHGYLESDNRSVIVKVLKEPFTGEQVIRFEQEYQITQLLKLPSVVEAIAFPKTQSSPVMILEDFGGKSLDKLQIAGRLGLSDFIDLAIKIIRILGEIHRHHVIHKDINPSNILMNPITGEVKLIDFGIATILSKQVTNFESINLLEGTLAYISPEQTGRVNRAIDYRTDFYSLGVTFYELLTGELPFKDSDPLALIHSHLAKPPILPHFIKSHIPQSLSRIIGKLLEKRAGDRYQSAYGIEFDLEKSRREDNFRLASVDVSNNFYIPQKLYGRSSEINTLLTAIENISQPKTPAEIIVINGQSGIGKSSLVKESYELITAKRGYFIQGTFEYDCSDYYSALFSCFSQLVEQILAESLESSQQWGFKLLEGLGGNISVMMELVPNLKLIIKHYPKTHEVAPNLNEVLVHFIKIFCNNSNYPLIIFLDNWQKDNIKIINLLESLLSDSQINNLLIIIAYRNSNMNMMDPLMLSLDQLVNKNVIVYLMILIPLTLEQVKELVSDTVHRSDNAVSDLAELIWKKTGGNPLFIHQFFKMLYSENLISFDLNQRKWYWDLTQIQEMGITDNIVDLMLGRLRKQPPKTKILLNFAACIGQSFNLNLLIGLLNEGGFVIASYLIPAIESELVMVLDQQSYKFAHGQIPEAIYNQLDADFKQKVHCQIATILLNRDKQYVSNEIFTIVYHMNRGIKAGLSNSEMVQIAKMNLKAAKKSKLAKNYQAAQTYLTIALELLDNNFWKINYDLMINLYLEAIEVQYLNKNEELANNLSQVVIEQAIMLLHKYKVYLLKIKFYIAQNRIADALLLGRYILIHDLEVKLINEISDSLKVNANQVTMDDPAKIATMKLLSSLFMPALSSDPLLLEQIVATMVNISIEYGHCYLTPFAYSLYGLILHTKLGNLKLGYEFGKLALNLVNEFNSTIIKCKVYYIFYGFLSHWKNHIKFTIEPLKEAINIGLSNGEIEYAGYAAGSYCYNLFSLGTPLEEVDKIYTDLITQIKSYGQDHALFYIEIGRKLVKALLNHEFNDDLLNEDYINDQTWSNYLIDQNNFNYLFIYYVNKLILAYRCKKYFIALSWLEKAAPLVSFASGSLIIAHYYYYSSLIYLSLDANQRVNYLAKVQENQALMAKWVEECPANFRHMYLLVEAEQARVLNQPWLAVKNYHQAIDHAQKHDYVLEVANAAELAAIFYLEEKLDDIAESYLIKARYHYIKWQAWFKVKDIELSYPNFFIQTPSLKYNSSWSNFTTQKTTANSLDLSTILKANEALSRDIVLDHLLTNLLKLILENAGAQTGYLLMQQASGEWVVVASGNLSSVEVLQSSPIDTAPLSKTVVYYTIQTQQSVVLNHAAAEGNFKRDTHISHNKIKSILCTPLINQGQLMAVVYLENNLSTGVFTPDRIETIQLLSRQAAIAISNAKLYTEVCEAKKLLGDYNKTLEEEVTQRTSELTSTLADLQAAQEELIQAEKMAALGQLVAGVAHEINNPLGVIRSSIAHISQFLTNNLIEITNILKEINPTNYPFLLNLLQQAYQTSSSLSTKEKREIKKSLIEKLESYHITEANYIADNLVDLGIYRQIEPLIPLFQSQDYEQVIQVAYDLGTLYKSAHRIVTATDRAAKIVFALKNYGRSTSITTRISSNIIEGMETVLVLYSNLFKKGVEVIRNYQEIPNILCYPDELNQVWTNLIYNALQAMNYQGTLTIDISADENYVIVNITDTGAGIPLEIRDYIFDPFFSTKPLGEGTGLGLSIVKKIIDKHQAEILIESVPGKTTFSVLIPKQLR